MTKSNRSVYLKALPGHATQLGMRRESQSSLAETPSKVVLNQPQDFETQ